MNDHIAGASVMTYYEGDALNWHFHQVELTTTLLLQVPCSSDEFEYLNDLGTEDDPNYDGIAAILTNHQSQRSTYKKRIL